MSRRAAIYCRISRDDEGDALGVQRQEKLCRAACARRGYSVVEVFTDNDISASGKVLRPEFERLLLSDVDVIVALDLDRLTRSHRDLIRLTDTGKAIETESGPIEPFVMEVLTSVASQELRTVSLRAKRKKQADAEAGRPNGGVRPYGYTSSRREAVVESEALAIKEAADRLLRGGSQGDVCRWLTSQGYTTTQGTEWSPKRLRRLLMRADIAGIREHDGQAYKGQWPAIIDQATHERLRAVLGQVRGRRASSQYLLTPPVPLAFCHCGKPLYGGGVQGKRVYRCSTAKSGCSLSIQAEPFEEHVVERMFSWAGDPEVVASRRAARQEALSAVQTVRDALRGLEVREERLADLAVDGTLSKAQVKRKRSELDAERSELERQLAKVESAEDALFEASGLDEMRKRWAGLTHGERRRVLRSVLYKVTVSPVLVPGRNFFDPDRVKVQPEWDRLLNSAS